jgi:hypothetical protein
LTGSAESVSSTEADMVGTHGAKRLFCPDTTNWNNLVEENCTTSVDTSLKSVAQGINKYSSIMTGYFKAPASGKYRFMIHGDDETEFHFETSSNTLEKIADSYGY